MAVLVTLCRPKVGKTITQGVRVGVLVLVHKEVLVGLAEATLTVLVGVLV